MFDEITIHTLTRTARDRMSLIARSLDTSEAHFQTELDLLEMLNMTREVITARLAAPIIYGVDPKTAEQTILVEAGHFEERKKDAKNNYSLLFDSIRKDIIEVIRTSFQGPDGRARGSIIQKYNTLGLDVIFDALHEVGPARAATFADALIKTFERNIMGLGEIDEMDSMIASKTLSNLSKLRARRNKKPMSEAQRFAAIANAVEAMQLLEAT